MPVRCCSQRQWLDAIAQDYGLASDTLWPNRCAIRASPSGLHVRGWATCENRHGPLKIPARSADRELMDVSSVAGLATRLSQQRTTDEAAVLVLKKAMQLQQSSALSLINATLTPSANLPAHLGQNVNVIA